LVPEEWQHLVTYSLYRTRDGAGDNGPMSEAIRQGDGKLDMGGDRPKVGYAMQVGSPYSRTYAGQDYWQTTYVTKILEESENRVKFETGNSTYEWEKF
jgi:hypothetical protein